jgi:aspartokinase/homoserine dehydrogenase 1
MKVLKFGGTSVASSKNIEQVRNIVLKKAKNGSILVVLSAFGGVTNKIEKILSLASTQPKLAQPLINDLSELHIDVMNELLSKGESKSIEALVLKGMNEISEIVKGISIVGEVSPKVRDRIVGIGERLSSIIVSAYFNKKLSTQLLKPIEIIATDDNYGSAIVNYGVTYANIGNLDLSNASIYVCPGFIGATEDGEITTLGRGGSDFTAALFASGLKAEELEIWTDVSGMMTADPRIVKKAQVINNLSYEEAMELSHFGAKVIYPPTIQPVLQQKIPIRIKNTLDPKAEGTLIAANQKTNGKSVQGLTSITNLALVNLKGPGMVGVPSLSYRLFRCFAEYQINVILITQASSEHTISVVIQAEDAKNAAKAVKREFELEIDLGKIDPLEVEKDLAIVALVGSNMQNQVGVSGKMFTTLGTNGVNIKAIAQGSSERNISTVIQSKNLKKALNCLHENFFLSERKRLNLFIIGVGNVGGEFLTQLNNQISILLKSEHLDIRVVGLANSKKMVFEYEGIDLSNWQDLLSKGSNMKSDIFVEKMAELNLRNSIFIDNTATSEIPDHYLDILKMSISIVTPNKVAASSDYQYYTQIKNTALRFRTQFLFETNVGAGLPIISTLNDLVKSGDKIIAIEAVLSGSLNFIFNNYNGEEDFASVVKQAQKEGYTEPDPRLDLSGLDVKRKLLILMREAGLECNMNDIVGEQFIPSASFDAKDVNTFYEILKENEDSFKALYNNAQKGGKRLKYVAQLKDGKATTKLLEIEKEHPFYNLEGKDNIVLYFTRRYPEQPLLIKGAGAGAEVTASGIFADVIKVAHS